MNLIFLDTECTGTEAEDRLLQIAFKDSGDVYKVNELFKPPLPIKIEAMAVHHITEAMVAGRHSFKESPTIATLKGLIDNEVIVVAHNAKFDIGMLEKEGLKVPRFICTMKVARELDTNATIPSYALQYLRYFLKMDIEAAAHDAWGDILVLEVLYQRLYTQMCKLMGQDRGLCGSGEVLDRMVQISSQPSKVKRFTFGKYKGQLVDDVYKKDAAYLDWLWREKMKENPRDDDWMATLEPLFMRKV